MVSIRNAAVSSNNVEKCCFISHHLYICMYVYICICICVYIYVHTFIYMYVRIYIHIHIYMYREKSVSFPIIISKVAGLLWGSYD